MFKVFDKDESGTMDFVEYMQAKKALTLDSIDDKLEWVFCLFDSDGGGSVDLKEIEVLLHSKSVAPYQPLFAFTMKEIVRSIFEFAGMKQDEKVVDACILDVKRTLDRDHDDCITKEEFIKHARRSKFIKNMFLK